MIFEKNLRKFLVEDNSLLSNILLTTTSDEINHIKHIDEKISFRRIDKKSEKDVKATKTDEKSDSSEKLKKVSLSKDTESNPFEGKGRVVVNPGKYINMVLKDKGVLGDTVSTHDIEQWVNKFKSYFSDNEELKIVNGEEIRWHYNSRNYTAGRGGSLWSCMSGNECQDRLDLYVKNPDTVELVVQYDKEKKVKSRALLWTLMDGNKMMDRIYYAEDKSVNTYKRLCKDNGWVVRDNGLQTAVKAPLKEWAHAKYPYLDTMRLMDIDDESGQYFITNVNIPQTRDYIIPNGTAGYTINNQVRIGTKWYPTNEAGYCGISGKGMLNKDLTEVPRHGKIENKLVDTDKWGKKFYKEDLVDSQIMKGKLSKKSAYQLNENGDWIGRKKYRKLVADGKLVDGSASYKNKLIWVLEDNVNKKTDLETKIKTDIASKLKDINKPIKDEDFEKATVKKLREIYQYATNKKYKSSELTEWENWALYKIEDESKETSGRKRSQEFGQADLEMFEDDGYDGEDN